MQAGNVGALKITPVSTTTGKNRTTSFGYICRRCSRCCQHKRIQLDPYEVARLARATGETISQFRAIWTIQDDQGIALRQKDDGACAFLGSSGCEVHADRPLACRLYPLGRHLRSDGVEYFTIQEGHPLSEGEFHNRGRITDYLKAQGAIPYLAAHDGYFKWLCWAQEQRTPELDGPSSCADDTAKEIDLLDMDAMIAKYCAANNELEPQNIDDRLQLHLKLLHDVVSDLEAKHVQENSRVSDNYS
jgi:uncharacterized protein